MNFQCVISIIVNASFIADVARQGCETLYDCCGKDLQSPGCEEVCKKCKAKWGTEAKECFERLHDLELVEINTN